MRTQPYVSPSKTNFCPFLRSVNWPVGLVGNKHPNARKNSPSTSQRGILTPAQIFNPNHKNMELDTNSHRFHGTKNALHSIISSTTITSFAGAVHCTTSTLKAGRKSNVTQTLIPHNRHMFLELLPLSYFIFSGVTRLQNVGDNDLRARVHRNGGKQQNKKTKGEKELLFSGKMKHTNESKTQTPPKDEKKAQKVRS